jgi:Bacterial type III secretion protein (HrpB7)
VKDVKALRTLVGVRRREATRLQARLAVERDALDQREAEVATAAAQRDAARAAEQAACEERAKLVCGPFTPATLRAMDFAVEDRVASVAQVDKALAASETMVLAQREAVRAVQADVQRNTERIERFEQRIAQALQKRDDEIEEATDEEAEETAAARFVAARRRSTGGESHHG